jgi:hypothetical protein
MCHQFLSSNGDRGQILASRSIEFEIVLRAARPLLLACDSYRRPEAQSSSVVLSTGHWGEIQAVTPPQGAHKPKPLLKQRTHPSELSLLLDCDLRACCWERLASLAVASRRVDNSGLALLAVARGCKALALLSLSCSSLLPRCILLPPPSVPY